MNRPDTLSPPTLAVGLLWCLTTTEGTSDERQRIVAAVCENHSGTVEELTELGRIIREEHLRDGGNLEELVIPGMVDLVACNLPAGSSEEALEAYLVGVCCVRIMRQYFRRF